MSNCIGQITIFGISKDRGLTIYDVLQADIIIPISIPMEHITHIIWDYKNETGGRTLFEAERQYKNKR